MSTVSVIARPTTTGWEGVYVHWDGYPEHHDPLLLAVAQHRFGADSAALAAYLIDEHPAGWSKLGADLAQAPDQLAQQLEQHCGSHSTCYCHGQRQEPPRELIRDSDRLPITDWAYVLRPQGLEVVCLDTVPPGGNGPLLPWTTDPQPASGNGRARFRSHAFTHWQPGQNPPACGAPATARAVADTARRRR